MKNLNVGIKIAQAKDLLEGKIGGKYLGSLDYSLLTDYIESEEELKEIIKVDGDRKYSNDIISVRFDYGWESVKYRYVESTNKIIKEFKQNIYNKYCKKHYMVESITVLKKDLKEISPLDMELLNLKKIEFQDYLEDGIFIKCLKRQNEELKAKVDFLKKFHGVDLNTFKKRQKKAIKKHFYKEYSKRIEELRKERNKCKKKNIEFEKEEELKTLIDERKEDISNRCNSSIYLKALEEFLGKIDKNNKIIKAINKKKWTEGEVKSTTKLREELYRKGFTIGDKHYVRFIRSSGSARVGKVLLINKKYYKGLMNWIYAGIDVEGQEIDLASFESYISLVASGSVGRFELKPENILLIEDYYSNFLNNEDTMVTRLIAGELETTRERLKISNNIFDGEALLDNSIFKETEVLQGKATLEDKATMQIRNIFYKGQAINCNIQQFFKDYFKENYEAAIVRDMFGNEILAKDIKLITTPSSLKYLKYFKDKKEGYDKWKEVALTKWAICKWDKKQHHFEGMTQTHYQLLNTLGLSRESMQELLKDTVDYINLLKTDDRVFKYNVNIKSELDKDFTINSKDKMIKALLTWNEDCVRTKVCWDYRREVVSSYIDNVRKGHILVEGNYSIVCNNVVEMLYASVGNLVEIDGRLQIKDKPEVKLEGYEAISMKFDNIEEFTAVRSPQPSMANVGVYKNRKCPNNPYFKELKKYFNTNSKGVIFTNSINVNKMEKFSSEDFDIDAELITNNPIITAHAKNIQHFAVNNDLTPKQPNPMIRTALNLAFTDVKTSVSKIGEVINLVQTLNSVYWDSIYHGSTHEDLEELYKDICQLNSLSCIEIDRCKKTSPVNTSKELKKIRKKGYLEDNVKPNFMKWCNEFEKGETKPNYKKFEAGMDYLEDIISDDVEQLEDIDYIKLSSIIKAEEKEANRTTLKKVTTLINGYFDEITAIYMNNMLNNKEKDFMVDEIEQKCALDPNIVNKLKDKKVIKTIIHRCERYEGYSKEIRKIKRTLTKEIDLERIYELNNELERLNKLREKFIDYKSFRRILKIIFLVDKSILLDCFKNKAEEYDKNPYTLYGYNKAI